MPTQKCCCKIWYASSITSIIFTTSHRYIFIHAPSHTICLFFHHLTTRFSCFLYLRLVLSLHFSFIHLIYISGDTLQEKDEFAIMHIQGLQYVFSLYVVDEQVSLLPHHTSFSRPLSALPSALPSPLSPPSTLLMLLPLYPLRFTFMM